jgi:hypothetical protein
MIGTNKEQFLSLAENNPVFSINVPYYIDIKLFLEIVSRETFQEQ